MDLEDGEEDDEYMELEEGQRGMGKLTARTAGCEVEKEVVMWGKFMALNADGGGVRGGRG